MIPPVLLPLRCAAQEAHAASSSTGVKSHLTNSEDVLPSMDSLSIIIDKAKLEEARDKDRKLQELAERNTALQQFFSAAKPLGLGVGVTPGSNRHINVMDLEGLVIKYQPSWLVSMIAGDHALATYNKVRALILYTLVGHITLHMPYFVGSWGVQ